MLKNEKIKIALFVGSLFIWFPVLTMFASWVSASSDLYVALGFAGLLGLIAYIVWVIKEVFMMVKNHITPVEKEQS